MEKGQQAIPNKNRKQEGDHSWPTITNVIYERSRLSAESPRNSDCSADRPANSVSMARSGARPYRPYTTPCFSHSPRIRVRSRSVYVVAHFVIVRVRRPIALGEMRKLLLDERQIPRPRRWTAAAAGTRSRTTRRARRRPSPVARAPPDASVIAGSTGITLMPVSMSASRSRASARSRASGVGARGSMRRASSRSSEMSER